MAMGTIGKVMHRTRKQLVTLATNEAADLFTAKFGLRDGDIVELKQWIRNHPKGGADHRWVKARIAEVTFCHYNSVGGYTAGLRVIPICQNGSLGCTRHAFMSIDKQGRDTETWNVRRIED
jgi:hypothetical protein